MTSNSKSSIHHTHDPSWLLTPLGDQRGYIQPEKLAELWFHMGTNCNLRCSFCFEGATPGNNRLQTLTFEDASPFIDEAINHGIKQFSFTGGEPFITRDILRILDKALNIAPCLVLTNATEPLKKRLHEIAFLQNKPHPLMFRISLDAPDEETHDKNRGKGNFRLALSNMRELYAMGFKLSVARHMGKNEDTAATNEAYQSFFDEMNLGKEIPIIAFPDLLLPHATPEVPHITEDCIKKYTSVEERKQFMCHHSAMLAKKNDSLHVYPCTLVDDDDTYSMGKTLTEALQYRVMLRHHRCYACFANGTTCSEL